ncbi:GyrI-like domain-containing protein [Campylobacter concisus]|uniref:AraC family transcriptional regulator n=1 Tax=Campylobacter concisus TaxID=199 RepID=A0A1Y5NF49_9BACT|nr:effector binding domain-containing protein [Campylobacter concisus]OUT19139.1 AraC family transcriptional regulator [Campylobacter concisus]
MKIINLEDSFEIYGVKTRTKNEDEIAGKGKILALWSKFMSECYDGKSEIYSVYCNYESDFNGHYDNFIGTRLGQKCDKNLKIQSGKYALFSFANEPQNVAKFWGEIWRYFESSELKRAYETDFELYGSDEIKIYISILG